MPKKDEFSLQRLNGSQLGVIPPRPGDIEQWLGTFVIAAGGGMGSLLPPGSRSQGCSNVVPPPTAKQRIIQLSTAAVLSLTHFKVPFMPTPLMWSTWNYNPRGQAVKCQSYQDPVQVASKWEVGLERQRGERGELWLCRISEAASGSSAKSPVILWFSTGGAHRDRQFQMERPEVSAVPTGMHPPEALP